MAVRAVLVDMGSYAGLFGFSLARVPIRAAIGSSEILERPGNQGNRISEAGEDVISHQLTSRSIYLVLLALQILSGSDNMSRTASGLG